MPSSWSDVWPHSACPQMLAKQVLFQLSYSPGRCYADQQEYRARPEYRPSTVIEDSLLRRFHVG
jgi:hypothetical protein